MASQHLSIGVNAYEANVAKRVGSNLYAYKLLCELERLTRQKQGDLQIDWVVYLPSAPLFDMPKARPGYSYRICPPAKLWTAWRLPLELWLFGRRHHVFFSLGHYAPFFCPVPQIVCILDLAFLKFPQFFLKKDLYQLTRWTARSVFQATHLFTISSSAKEDIKSAYQKKDEQITIAYPGVEVAKSSEGSPSQALQKFGLEEKRYIVVLGTIQPRKNIVSVIKAFEQFNPTEGNAYTLVLVGKSGWLTEEFEQVRRTSSQKEKIIVTGFVEDEDKWTLLRHACVSVLVGFYEGFGIPALESMSVGVRPIVANAASLPEVVGKFGVLVDPYSIESIAAGLSRGVKESLTPFIRAEMIEWTHQFSWESSAQKVLRVLEEKFALW